MTIHGLTAWKTTSKAAPGSSGTLIKQHHTTTFTSQACSSCNAVETKQSGSILVLYQFAGAGKLFSNLVVGGLRSHKPASKC